MEFHHREEELKEASNQNHREHAWSFRLNACKAPSCARNAVGAQKDVKLMGSNVCMFVINASVFLS
jgi:hypothetical protein